MLHSVQSIAERHPISSLLQTKYNITVCLKKRLLRRCVIFNPKNVTIGSGVDQNKKSPSF